MGDRAAWLTHIREDPDQLGRVERAMMSGRWWTKHALAQVALASPHALSARFSDLRKKGHHIQRKYEGDGVYLYRIAPQNTITAAPAGACKVEG